jgi:hypothetical protein
MSVLKDLKPLSPSAFFEVRGKIPKAEKKRQFKKGLLPNTTGLTGEGRLISLALLWSPVGIYVEMGCKLGIENGDQLELFMDTRDLKTSNVITRFCHHFSFDLEEMTGAEVTRFRGEDSHELADSDLITIKTEVKRTSYRVEIALPKEILYGYDPVEFKRLGFCYRFKRKNGENEHFNLSSDYFNLEKHPALWASMELMG